MGYYGDFTLRKYLKSLQNDYDDARNAQRLQTLLDTLETSVGESLASEQAYISKCKSQLPVKPETNTEIHPRGSVEQKLHDCSQSYGAFLGPEGVEVHPLRCKHKACPVCQRARQGTISEQLQPMVDQFSAPKHITLTIASNDLPLRIQVQHLTACFKRLRETTLWKTRTPFGWWFLEVTYNQKRKQFHPHLHLIVNMKYIPWQQLSAAWKSITGTSFIVHVRAPKSFDMKYVLKYVRKASSIWQSPAPLWEISQAMKGLRSFQPFGHWPKRIVKAQSELIYLGTITGITRLALAGNSTAQSNFLSIWTRFPDVVYWSLIHSPP